MIRIESICTKILIFSPYQHFMPGDKENLTIISNINNSEEIFIYWIIFNRSLAYTGGGYNTISLNNDKFKEFLEHFNLVNYNVDQLRYIDPVFLAEIKHKFRNDNIKSILND